jgi:phosphopantetheinyl transferase (holo-ACP synthase)
MSLQMAAFYRRNFFHGPRYQGINRIISWSDQGVEAEVSALAGPPFFSGDGVEKFMLPVTALDCAGQLSAWWLHQAWGRGDFGIYPFALERYRQHRPLWSGHTPLRCQLKAVFENGVLEGSLRLSDGEGHLLAGLEGYRLRYVQYSPRMQALFVRPADHAALSRPWLQDQAGLVVRRVDDLDWDFLSTGQGIWQRMLANLYLSREEREEFYTMSQNGPRRAQWLLGRLAAKEAAGIWLENKGIIRPAPADLRVAGDENGRPELRWAVPDEDRSLPRITISHCGTVAVAAAGEPEHALGLDYENAAVSKPGPWLREAFTQAELSLAKSGDDQELLALWCAKEAAAKALGLGLRGGPTAFRITTWDAGSGRARVKSPDGELAVRIWRKGSEVLALCGADAG